jgi:sugar phosphate isomerase/epimerase
MKLGFLTACLPGTGLDPLVAWASAQGFQTLELAAWPVQSARDYQAGQIDAASFDAGDASHVRELFAKHGMSISAMAYYENNLEPDPGKRAFIHAHLKKVIRAASMLNVELVGTFVGARPDRTPLENMKEIGVVFRDLAAFARDHGVRLMIENCPMENWQRFGLPGNYAYSPELWEALFNEVPDGDLGLNFDPSHLVWLGIDPLKAAREFASKILHVHAKDTQILVDGRYRYGLFSRQLSPVPGKSGWWRYRMPGQGAVDWEGLIAVLREGGYDSVLSIEHEDPDWEESEEKVKAGLVLGLKYLSSVVRQ